MERFRKATRQEPCPVCGHTDWCVVSNDGGTCICFRTESDRPHAKGGWIHVLKRIAPPTRRTFHVAPPVRKQLLDAERAMSGFRAEFGGDGVKRDIFDSAIEIGQELGLTGAVVDRLECGRSRFYMAWCFPMRDGSGKIVGIRLRRYGTSDKYSVAGSRDGLFYDPDIRAAETVSNGMPGREIVIVEGASDCAAGYEIGLACVGRSSCMTGAAELKDLCVRLRVNRVTIVTDNDNAKVRITPGAPGLPPTRTRYRPGLDGAMKLAHDLGRMYRIVTPPKKDLRDWVHAGCTGRMFNMVAELQKWRMPE